MAKLTRSRLLPILGGVVLVAGVGSIGFALGAQKPVPVGVISHYSAGFLLGEAQTMNECAECHEADKFHGCAACHDEHGAVEFAGVPFYAMIAFTGDVPEPGFITVNDVLPYRDHPNTHVALLDFLAEQGVTDFESVTLASNDGGFVTIEPANLNERALLLPYEDGIRFASEDLHVSTWLKGITRIVVVGRETPLSIDGQPTSIGRLLLGPTRLVTVEQTDVMFASEEDGQVREAKTASRFEGAPIEEFIANPAFEQLEVRVQSGETYTLTAEEARSAILVPDRDGVVLVLPERGRSQWIEHVVEIRSR